LYFDLAGFSTEGVRAGGGIVAKWLFKEEPDHYSYADLESEGTTLWDGVTNALARLNLRKVRKGDRILFYHTGKQKAVVGEMVAVKDAMDDPNEDDPKAVVVKVKAVRKLLRAVPLTQIKEDPALANWQLVRFSRLSVMPVTEDQWRRVEEMSDES
jgi:predicted RNA-binding protein with PUA-like domain